MWKSVLSICLGLILMLSSFSPVPAGPTGLAQDCDPQNLRVRIEIPEIIIGPPPVPDPAAETEMISRFREAGFTVVSRNSPADVIILGEGFGNTTSRDPHYPQLWISRARVEARAIKTADGTIIGAGDAEASARDISQQVGAKAALRNAGGVLADELIARIARRFQLCPRPRRPSRVSTAVIRFTAPGLPPDIDFSTRLSDALTMLGVVDVVVAGQDLEAVLSQAHAGIIPVPDVALIGTVERAEMRHIAVIPVPPGMLYINEATLSITVRAVDTETGEILTTAFRESTRRGVDIVCCIIFIRSPDYDRTLLGQLTRDILKELADEITPAVIYALPDASYFDVVTIRNGDRFGGTILNPDFTIVTSFGQSTIPTANIASLVVGNPSRMALIDGSTLTGQILDPGLIVDGFGTIPMSQVATVVFAIK
jgi:hypothetical protein